MGLAKRIDDYCIFVSLEKLLVKGKCMKKIWTKVLAYMLAVTMCFGVVNAPVYAQESAVTEALTEKESTSEAVTEEATLPGNDAETTTEKVASTEETGSTEKATVDDSSTWDQVTTENVFEGENYKVIFTLTSNWDSGYNAKVKLENTGYSTIQNWYLGFDYNNSITNIWNAEISSNEGSEYVIKNVGWNQDIVAGNSIEFGLSGDHAFKGFPENYELIGTSKEVAENDYTIQYKLDSDWGTGFTGSISITNNTDTALEDWVLEFDFDREITEIWDGVIENHEGNHYIVRNAEYNSAIAPDEKVSIGIKGCGGALGDDLQKFNLYSSVTSEVCTVSFDVCAENVSGIPSVQRVTKGECISEPALPTREGYIFIGWYLEATYEVEFDIETKIERNLILYARWFDCSNNTDTDGDGIIDELEVVIGTNPNSVDTDGDGLTDYEEMEKVYTNPLRRDSDDNGIEDGDEDYDSDGITNKSEIELGTDPTVSDTDEDGVNDYDEVNKYSTNPILVDTDADGVSDGKEIELGTDPLVYQALFMITETIDLGDSVIPSVTIELAGNQVETLDINIVEDELLFPNTIPGYIGAAYDFSVDGTFEEALLNFQFNEKLLEDETFDPVIYYFNEQDQQLEELETSVNGNIASAKTNHFSTYILINRKVFEESKIWIDEWDSQGYSGVEVVLVIDDSGSMTQNDGNNKRLKVAQNLIENLPSNSKVGVVKFASYTTALTPTVTSDKEVAKNYLTPAYFRSSGGTYMYNAISSAFSLFETTDDTILKMIVVLSDGETSDIGKHTSVIATANNNGVKVYTVGLGNSSSSYFTRYLKPLANNTAGTFYLASNANQLEDIYNDINNKIDIETDSDNDGIADYYEDNMVLFNNVKIKLDKNNPDSDGDGLTDGQEVVELKYEYNEDKTKVRVTGKLLSSPINADTDGDLDIDSIDPEPFDYQLNDLLCYNISKLNDLAIAYKNQNNYSSGEYNTKVEAWLTFMFIRQFSSSYVSVSWDGTGKAIDTGFVNYVKAEDIKLYAYFESKTDYYATATGETGDLYHLAATATGCIYKSDYGDGVKFGLMPEYHLDNLSGWAGDLQTAMNDAMVITNKSNDYNVFKEAMSNLIGYDAKVNDVYSGYSHTFDMDDVYADTDAYNVYKLLNNGKTMEAALDNYYKGGYKKRYTEFTNNWSEAKVKDTTYIYTKNKYMGVIRWPLFKYDFKANQSKAARDAFAEFVLERRKSE